MSFMLSCAGWQELKAALDDALAALAPHTDAQAMWERLLSCVVVQPLPSPDGGGLGAVPYCDITYQLHEIEVSAWCAVAAEGDLQALKGRECKQIGTAAGEW